MQKNNITEDFDLFIKGSLQDAEEKPSPRVWQGIVSRLDAAEAPSAGAFRWGWAVLAVAAALAAVLVIPDNSNLSTISSERQALAQATAIEITAIPSAREIGALPHRIGSASGVMPGKGSGEIAGQAGNDGTEKDGTDGTEKDGKGSASGVTPGAAGHPDEGGVEQAASADPFAEMAYEDGKAATRKAGRRPSIWAGGAMGGNESSSGGAAYASKSSNPAYIENEILETTASNYGIPLSVGAGVKFGLGDGFAASVGVDYTYLTRSFTGTYSPAGAAPVTGEINQAMRYIGIPAGVYYHLIGSGNVKFYLFGVGEAEWCLGNSYNIRNGGATVSEKVGGTQFSAGGGFGVDFTLSKHLSLYVDPAVRYYFDCGQPGSIRTEKPLMINFSTGLRFNL